jgi:hypothetical protein
MLHGNMLACSRLNAIQMDEFNQHLILFLTILNSLRVSSEAEDRNDRKLSVAFKDEFTKFKKPRTSPLTQNVSGKRCAFQDRL